MINESNSNWTSDRIEEVIETYSNMLFKICLVATGNQHDAEDAVQETYLRYIRKSPTFKDKEHEKAWLIRVATNICKDIKRQSIRHPQVDIAEIAELGKTDEHEEILRDIMELSEKYRIVLILFYVEGYKIPEIATILDCSVDAIKKRLQRGRELLRVEYGKECLA